MLSGLNNFILSRALKPLPRDEIESMEGVSHSSVDITQADYDRLIQQTSLSAYARYRFAYSKVLEYAASLKLLRLNEQSVILDAAGGNGEFLHAARGITRCQQLYCNDLLQPEKVEGGIHYIGKSVEAIDLPPESLSAIACHHSIEHFRGDADMGFIDEIVRLLRPGGRACIVPIFLAQPYAEIWNTNRKTKFDERAATINDPFATFTGWGSFEGFARVYNPESFHRRIVSRIPEKFKASLVAVTFEGQPCPRIDPSHNSHQPPINRAMRALVIERNE